VIYRTSSTVRLLTDLDGKLRGAVGIAPDATSVVLQNTLERDRRFSITPNAKVDVAHLPS